MCLRKKLQGEKGYSDFQGGNTEGILYFLQEYTNTSARVHKHFIISFLTLPVIFWRLLERRYIKKGEGRFRLLILTLYLPSLDWVHVQKAETCQKSINLRWICKLLLVFYMQISFLCVLIYVHLGNSRLKILAADEYSVRAALGTPKMLSCIWNLKFFISN